MAKTHPPYAPEFRRQMVELVRSGGPNPIGSSDRNLPLFRICSAVTFHTDAAGAHCPRR